MIISLPIIFKRTVDTLFTTGVDDKRWSALLLCAEIATWQVEQTYTVNGTAAVQLGGRLHPPAGATVVTLGGPGAGQFRLVTGRLPAPYVNTYTLSAPFDGWLRPNVTKVAALPTAAQKLIVGNLLKTSI